MMWPKAKRVLVWAGDDWRDPEDKTRRLVPTRTLMAALRCFNKKCDRRDRAKKRESAP